MFNALLCNPVYTVTMEEMAVKIFGGKKNILAPKILA